MNYAWDTITSQLIIDRKYEATFDAKGHQTTLIGSKWNNSTSQWIASRKDESTYDANGKITSLSVYNWDTLTSQWVGSYKSEHCFDNNGNNTMLITYSWDSNTNQWSVSSKASYYYSMYDIISRVPESGPQTVKLYPNPANKEITLEIDNKSVTSCHLYNSSGQLIKTLKINDRKNTYNISDLQAGFYFIKISLQNGMIIRKMIKN